VTLGGTGSVTLQVSPPGSSFSWCIVRR